MDILLLGPLLLAGGLIALLGGFDFGGNDSSDDNGESPSPEPDPATSHPHGGSGDDSLAADHGLLSGWGGDDHLTLTGTAQGYGNQGDDTLEAHDQSRADGGLGDDSLSGMDSSQSHGGDGNDFLDIHAGASGWGGAGNDVLSAGNYGYVSGAHATVYGGDGNDSLDASAGQAFGDGGDDVLHGLGSIFQGTVTELYGGEGQDHLFAAENTLAYGDAGNDVISLSYGAQGYGGLGDDTLILSATGTHAYGTDTNPISATGGAGSDSFAIDLVPPSTYSTVDPMVITDYDPALDHLVVESTGGRNASYVFDHASSIEHTQAGYTEVTLHWHGTDDAQTVLTNTLRLEGVLGFDPATIEIASTVLPEQPGVVGAILQPVTGSAGPDHLYDQSNSYLTTGAGNDVVTTGASGDVVANLGEGDDSFTATGAAHVVFGGAGDDSYVLDAPLGQSQSPLNLSDFYNSPNVDFDGGAGNDSILIRNDGSTSNLTYAAHARYEGGAGDDHLEAMAGTGQLIMNGGEGNDVLIGRAGQFINTDDYFDEDTDDVTLNLTASELAANGAAQIRLLGDDHLTLNLDADLQGEISFHYNTAGNGAEVNSSEIRVGGVTVAIVREGIPLIEDAIALGDSQLTVHRL
jgi:hypothetical protein